MNDAGVPTRSRARQSGEVTRADLLDAARKVLGEHGLAHATTKQIARAAGYSEATLYKHFDGKLALFLAVLNERMPRFGAVINQLPDRVGSGAVVDHLTAVARAALDFYEQSFPITASLFAEPDLLRAHVDVLSRLDSPGYPKRTVAAYLAAEQQQNRVSSEVDVEAAAAMLLGACFQHAFLLHFDPTARAGDANTRTSAARESLGDEREQTGGSVAADKAHLARTIAATVTRALC